MKAYFVLVSVICLFLIIFPLAVIGFKSNGENTQRTSNPTHDTDSQYTYSDEKEKSEIKVLRVSSGKVITLELYDYLVGCIASEISPLYEKEAIKAQVVASYTYAKWLMENADNASLSGADITDSAETHQGFLDEKELNEKWGDKAERYLEKIRECVDEVYGEYMTYDGETVIACYHAISPGKTADALTVWGKDIGYLKSVTAVGDVLSPDIDSTVKLTSDQFKSLIEKEKGISLGKDAKKWIGKIKTDEKTGFVISAEIGSVSFDGNDLRSIFSLKSPFFTVEYKDKCFVFSVKGYGHGLGMSQYSADYMARQGSSYKEILKHFYSGIEIVKE